MVEENISQEFRLKNVDETRNYLFEEINRNELISKKHRNFCTTLNCTDNFFILSSTVTGCISISSFSSLVGILKGITSSAIGLKMCAIIPGIKKYMSIIKNKRKRSMIN